MHYYLFYCTGNLCVFPSSVMPLINGGIPWALNSIYINIINIIYSNKMESCSTPLFNILCLDFIVLRTLFCCVDFNITKFDRFDYSL